MKVNGEIVFSFERKYTFKNMNNIVDNNLKIINLSYFKKFLVWITIFRIQSTIISRIEYYT